jgi:hypothetical protein
MWLWCLFFITPYGIKILIGGWDCWDKELLIFLRMTVLLSEGDKCINKGRRAKYYRLWISIVRW